MKPSRSWSGGGRKRTNKHLTVSEPKQYSSHNAPGARNTFFVHPWRAWTGTWTRRRRTNLKAGSSPPSAGLYLVTFGLALYSVHVLPRSLNRESGRMKKDETRSVNSLTIRWRRRRWRQPPPPKGANFRCRESGAIVRFLFYHRYRT